jgi:hypothetical protein
MKHKSGMHVLLVFGGFFTPPFAFSELRGEIEKGRRTSFSLRTQRPSLPIISSLAGLFARWLFHPRTPNQIVR